jgi:hypothetical protein
MSNVVEKNKSLALSSEVVLDGKTGLPIESEVKIVDKRKFVILSELSDQQSRVKFMTASYAASLKDAEFVLGGNPPEEIKENELSVSAELARLGIGQDDIRKAAARVATANKYHIFNSKKLVD